MIDYCTCGHIKTHHQQAAIWLPVHVCTWKGCDCVDFTDADRKVRAYAR